MIAILNKNTLSLNFNTYFLFKNIRQLKYFKSIFVKFLIKSKNLDLIKELKNNLIIYKNSFSRKHLFFKLNNLTTSKHLSNNVYSATYINNFAQQSIFNLTKFYNQSLLHNNSLFLLNLNKIFLNSIENILFLFFNPLFFKFFNQSNNLKKNNKTMYLNTHSYINDNFFYSPSNVIFKSNLLPYESFDYIIKKKILKIFSYSKFPVITSV